MTTPAVDYAPRPPYRMSGGLRVLLWTLLGLALLPVAAALGVVVLLVAHDWKHSGSLRGDAALERARHALQDVGGDRWRVVAFDARAEWSPPDMGGDRIEHYAFTLPQAEIAPFQAALEAKWTHRSNEGRSPNDLTVNYIFEGASLLLHPETGRVEIEWANFYSLTPTSRPAAYDAPSTRPRS